MDENAQISAEMILLMGAILVIVIVAGGVGPEFHTCVNCIHSPVTPGADMLLSNEPFILNASVPGGGKASMEVIHTEK